MCGSPLVTVPRQLPLSPIPTYGQQPRRASTSHGHSDTVTLLIVFTVIFNSSQAWAMCEACVCVPDRLPRTCHQSDNRHESEQTTPLLQTSDPVQLPKQPQARTAQISVEPEEVGTLSFRVQHCPPTPRQPEKLSAGGSSVSSLRGPLSHVPAAWVRPVTGTGSGSRWMLGPGQAGQGFCPHGCRHCPHAGTLGGLWYVITFPNGQFPFLRIWDNDRFGRLRTPWE